MSALRRLSLRSRFLLLVLLGVALPLGLAGSWIAWTSQRSAEELLRTRLRADLGEHAHAFGTEWSRKLSTLIDLADSSPIHAMLRQEGGLDSLDLGAREILRAGWQQASEFAWAIELRALDGRLVVQLPDDLGESSARGRPPPGFVDYDVPVRERFSGQVKGTLGVQFRSDALLTLTESPVSLSGTLLVMLDRRTGVALSTLPLDPAVLEHGRFEWGEEDWVAEVRDINDPPVRFALAAPLGPIVTPLQGAARDGMIALALVAAAALWFATLFSGRLTRSLESLSAAARAVADGDLTARAPEIGPPSVRDTARTFNRMSAALRETLDELSHREALAAVGEFAAALAHEVRNPLTAIRMDVERAGRKSETDPEAAAALVDRALAEIDRLNASVTSVLRIARSGKANFAPLDLRDPIAAAVRSAAPRFTEAGCRLHHDVLEEPLWVDGDAYALEELVLNLLLNAADALAPGGEAGVRVETEGDRVRVSVWDHGMGIAEADLQRVFEPFFTTRRTGTGLGLSIARRMSRAHGSDLMLDSNLGKGSTFSFELRQVDGPSERGVTDARNERNDSRPRLRRQVAERLP